MKANSTSAVNHDAPMNNSILPQNNTAINNSINTNSGTVTSVITVGEVLQHQSSPDGWICPLCIHHRGDINCAMNMFISFTGCYIKDCQTFKERK